ncbi:immunity protein YezG family protein [Secundilactobacillus oryzae]|uniref:immunity protein YezG family protein n=1 Tax=Secundilactobacillus oryzae TaxID=1202668 RepID=UPI0006D0CF6D|nr:immunity protein YezG family protein [Secundilactobacillus oryzae]
MIQLYSFTLFYRVLKPGNIKQVWTVYFSLAVLSLVGGFLIWISELLLVWQIPTFILLILGFFGTIISVGSVVMPFVIVPIMTVTLLANRNWAATVETNPNESEMDRLIKEIRREISGQIPLQWADLVAFCNFSDGVTINYYFNDYGEPNRYFKGDTIATGYSAFESRTLSPVTEKVSELRQLLQKQDTKAISYLILTYRTEAELTVTHADWQATQFADDQIAAYYADKYLQNVPLRGILPALSEEVAKEMDRVALSRRQKLTTLEFRTFIIWSTRKRPQRSGANEK